MPSHNALTYDRFAAGADELVASGVKPSRLTYRMLREKVGGSNSTIEKYLKAYLDSRPNSDLHKSIPPELVMTVTSVLARERSAAQSEFAEQLAFVEKQKDELLADLSGAEEVVEERTKQLVELATERDSARGQCAQLLDQLASVKEELSAALQQLEFVKHQASAGQSQLDVSKGTVEELRTQTEARLSAMRSELSAYATQSKDANRHAKEVEVKLAEARVHLEAERTARITLNERLCLTEAALQNHQTQAVKAAVDAAQVSSLKQQLALVQRGNATLEALVKTLVTPEQHQTAPAES